MYCTLPEIKQRIQKVNVDADAFLPAIIDGAEKAINRFCNRPDGFEAIEATRYFPGNGKGFLLIDEYVAVEEVAVKDSATDIDYVIWTSPSGPMTGDGDWLPFSGDPQWPDFNSVPYDGLMVDINGNYSTFTSGLLARARAFPRQSGSLERQIPMVRVEALWGYSLTAPSNIREACVMQSAIWYKRMQGSMASALASAELGELELFRVLDPAVEFVLRMGRYMRPPTGRR